MQSRRGFNLRHVSLKRSDDQGYGFGIRQVLLETLTQPGQGNVQVYHSCFFEP